jgi:hypothetical protein
VIFLIISTVGFAIGTLSKAMVEFQWARLFGRRRMEHEISDLRNRLNACGAGRADHHAAPGTSSRGALDCNPNPIQTIAAGDSLIVMANSQKRRQFAYRAGVKE